jgi:hypothetical protein
MRFQCMQLDVSGGVCKSLHHDSHCLSEYNLINESFFSEVEYFAPHLQGQVGGLERGPLSLVTTTEELLE